MNAQTIRAIRGRAIGGVTGVVLALGIGLLALEPSGASAAGKDATEFWQNLKQQGTGKNVPSVIVGKCGEYVSIPGTARITRVVKTGDSSHQATVGGGPGYEGYEVWFAFTPAKPASDGPTRAWIGKQHQLRLGNSWYPGPKFIRKYDLKAGRSLQAVLKVQKSGPCTPFVFDFPSVNTTDYFESGR